MKKLILVLGIIVLIISEVKASGTATLNFIFPNSQEREITKEIANKAEFKEVFAWVAKEMNIQINPEIPLPKIEIVSPEEIMEIAVRITARDFEGTIFWKNVIKGRSQEELIKEAKDSLAQARKNGNYELVYDGGLYDPYTNSIFLIDGCSKFMLAHETTHYFQVQYQKRYWERETFKTASEQEQVEILKEYWKLEDDAEEIEKKFKEEFPSESEILTQAP